MSTEHSVSMASRPDLIQASSRLQEARRNQPVTLVLRALGTGLFFVMLVLFASPAFAVDATLAWDPNTETDLEGYGVYFRQGKPGPPYDLFGYVTMAELTDPSSPTFTLTGLVQGARYYIALTAYDTGGAESSFSSAVCADVGTTITACPASAGDGGGSGGGGGAACFIGTLRDDFGPFEPWIAGLVSLAAFLGFVQRRFKRSFLFSRYDTPRNQRRSNLDA